MAVTVIAVLTATEGRRDELLEVVTAAAEDFHTEPGCRLWAPHASGKHRVLIVESYLDRDALGAHGESDRFARLQTEVRDLLATPMEVTLGTPAPAGDEAKGAL